MSNLGKYLARPFIYRSREDIDSFLDESKLWQDLYELFLLVKDNAYYLKVPSVKMFNEVRYQCVRLMLDKHPEEDIYGNYLNDAKVTLGWRYASDLCFSMVYAILSLLKNPPIQITRFCYILCEKKLKTEQCYFPYFEQFVEDHKKKDLLYDIDLAPEPESPIAIRNAAEEIQTISNNGSIINRINYIYDKEWWRNQTRDFDQDTIREIVFLWKEKQDQLEVIKLIELAFDETEQKPEQSADTDDLPF